MTAFTPDEQFDSVKAEVTKTIQSMFPIENSYGKVTLSEIMVDDKLSSGDIRSQRKALSEGRDWSVPIYGRVAVHDKEGKKTSERKLLLGHVPKTTDRFGYILGGNEYQVLNQFRLKPGVYHRQAPDGELVSEFALGNQERFARGRTINVRFDPAKAQYRMVVGTSNVPLYPVLKELGATDEEIEKAWGKEVLAANQKVKRGTALKAFYRAIGETPPEQFGEAEREKIRSVFGKTELRPDTTKATLGQSFTSVTPAALLSTTNQLLRISRGEREPDDKSSLEFQQIFNVGDMMGDQLRRNEKYIRRTIDTALKGKSTARGIVPSKVFDSTLRKFFQTSLVNQNEQTNPLEMVSGARRTTITGEFGGIKSEMAISEDAKLVSASHLGFLDPIHTPESEKTGVALSIPLGAAKRGNELVSRFYDTKAKKWKELTSGEALHATIAFPDQYQLSAKGARPLNAKVRATKDGEVTSVDPSQVDYVLPSARAMFGVTSNMIPFLQNNQGNRAMTAARQQEQALPLKHREAPLVQVSTDQKQTFENLMGSFAARKAPVAGEVVDVLKDAVIIKDAKGKTHEVQVYRDFALAGGSAYDSEITVKKGDKVKKGQLVADSNFTKGGDLALGTNLHTAYMPYHGYNFEDGIVISESASKKLTSLHIHNKDVAIDANTKFGLKPFLSQWPAAFKKDQLTHIEPETGLPKVGSRVNQGDPLILAVRKPDETQTQKTLASLTRSRAPRWRDRSLTWDKPYPGVVTEVVKRDGQWVVYVKTEEPAQVGDKLVGRHGNKGIVTRIIPDAEMPYRNDAKGNKEPLDILMNPMGVPGRINLGQVLETAAGKVARAAGKPYVVKNFEAGKDYLGDVQGALAKAGLKDKEVLYDPMTGKAYEQEVMAGEQYVLKLKHQATKKIAARSGSGSSGVNYDVNRAPTSGSKGGQRLGELGMYSMLAHGARENLHEMYAYKTNENLALWDALREGTPLPPPQTPFAYDKFMGYMNGLRMNVRKEGNSLQLVPFTEDQVLAMSSGEIKSPGLVIRGKDTLEMRDGLFDPKVTGGKEGTKWSHIKLPEPIPNPLFEEAIQKLTGIKGKDFKSYMNGTKEVDGLTGGQAIEALLKKIDVKKELKTTRLQLDTLKAGKRSDAYKRYRILKALDAEGLTPEVYMMKTVPVLPPVYRPIVVKEDGSLNSDDMNGMYKDLGSILESYNVLKNAGIKDSAVLDPQREAIYDAVKASYGLGGSLTREYRGIIDIIAGKTRQKDGSTRGVGKTGYFQQQVMKRRQDFSGRSIIVPEPKLGLDELGLPETMAWELYKPFIQRNLTQNGYPPDEALQMMKKKHPAAIHAMERVVNERPVWLKRDPSLHKFNVMPFYPKLTKGKAIEIHPLVTGGFNADFDGDTMSVFLPITDKAVKEAQDLVPSKNLFNPTTGGVMYMPGHEALLGLYLLTTPGKKTNKTFKTLAEAQAAERKGQIHKTNIVRVGGHETTVGRMEVEAVLPASMRQTGKVPVSKMKPVDKKVLEATLTRIAKSTPQTFGDSANKLKDLGNEYSTAVGFSIGLSDFTPIGKAGRDKTFQAAERKADTIRASKTMTAKQKNSAIVKVYQTAGASVSDAADAELKANPTNIYQMVASGSRGKPSQLKQIVSTPALVMDAKGNVVPSLIPRSYAEGMDVASYWTTMHGARKGTIQKTQGVRDPGYMSKRILNATMSSVITVDDCGVKRGVRMAANDPDTVDRYLSNNMRVGKRRYRAGSLVTSETISSAAKGGVSHLQVRSPLKCLAPTGICRKCMGLTEAGKGYEIGTNVGVIAGQALGEPATQLSLNTFHEGGLATGKASRSQATFRRMEELLELTKNVSNQAPLAVMGGRVTNVMKAPAGGHFVDVGSKRHYVPEGQDVQVKKGQRVGRGDALGNGNINPLQLLPLKGLDSVQDYLTEQTHEVLKDAGNIKRRNVEVVVRTMTNLAEVQDPGGHAGLVPGDSRSVAEIQAWNQKYAKKGVKPIQYTPKLHGINTLPLMQSEDWMARLNFQRLPATIIRGAREGWSSALNSFHPIPSLAQGKDFNKSKTKQGPDWQGQY